MGRVGVYDEHEIFRLGVVTCLSDDPTIMVVSDGDAADLDLAIASLPMAGRHRFGCGILICAHDPAVLLSGTRDPVVGVLPRGTLTARQLLAAVHAAVAGLSVSVSSGDGISRGSRPTLAERQRQVLRLLAEGASTAEISRALHCSERTVKSDITDLRRGLHAHNRAHLVAASIRLGVI